MLIMDFTTYATIFFETQFVFLSHSMKKPYSRFEEFLRSVASIVSFGSQALRMDHLLCHILSVSLDFLAVNVTKPTI